MECSSWGSRDQLTLAADNKVDVVNELKQEDRIAKLELQLDLQDLLPLSRSRCSLRKGVYV